MIFKPAWALNASTSALVWRMISSIGRSGAGIGRSNPGILLTVRAPCRAVGKSDWRLPKCGERKSSYESTDDLARLQKRFESVAEIEHTNWLRERKIMIANEASAEKLVTDLKRVVQDSEELLKDSAGVVSEKARD